MQLFYQIKFKEDIKAYNRLKQNSSYIKEFNRGNMEVKRFLNEMNEVYKERTTDKLSVALDNMELISSLLDVLK